MKVPNKFRVLQVLSVTSFIQAGRLQGKGRWYLSLYTFMYLIGMAILIESLFEEAQQSLMGGGNEPGPCPGGSQGYDNNGSLTPKIDVENAPEDNPDRPPPPNNTCSENDMEVVRLTMNTNGILSAAISLILRSFGIIFFPQIITSFRELIARELCEKSRAWTRDELLFFFVIICGVSLQFVNMNAGRNDFGMTHIGKTFQNLFRIVIFLFECYPLDCTAFALVVFTTVVTENLQELCSLLGPNDDDDGKVEVGNDHVENLSEKIESLIDFQLTAKLRATAAKMASTGKIPAVGTHSSKKVQPVFIIHHHEPGLEILGLKDMTYLTRRYLLWHELWEEASGLTGFITLVLFLSSTVNLCIYSYSGITGFSTMGFDGMAMQNCALAVLSILRLLCLGNAAQNLIDVGEELEEKLIMEAWEEESSDYFVSLDMEKEKEISYLLHHMAQHPIRLSALGFFTASRSTLTSIAGVIVTYLVVLIQFGAS